ncbi:GNAT family N-acetyltransferase [Clostridium sp.]|uniref:GNAT family N-acetyltransferase n=1 Tax=Clostridium sp. TaxID=1506 RepID=UPI0032165463
MMIRLVQPELWLKDKFIEMLNDYNANEEDLIRKRYSRVKFDFQRYVDYLKEMAKGINLQPRHVASSEWWLLNENDDILGTVRLRYELNETNYEEGGHIGYDISPKYRKKGYGKIILKLILEKARTLGFKKVLITCDFDNIGSKNIIENNGGKLENTIISKESGKEILRYWIEL